MIRNLINNAIKFTNAGGEIIFKAKQIGGECWLIIRDNGIGITEEKQSELFSLRAGTTFGTNNEKGVGLGLLLCKEFTELQGGRIWLESNPGEGTAFYVAMPAGN
ncbi:sensor histidine kinase [Mucilaginibacter sp.]|uniref:sensor histidine kinase n=1 Tax=Mucilaginibacter sp. TaxID=1882438 RepID=UPI0032664FF0